MELKNFTAPSIAEALLLVKEKLGDDAVIISTENTEQGALVVAAVEEKISDFSAKIEVAPTKEKKTIFNHKFFQSRLDYHGVLEDSKLHILESLQDTNMREEFFNDEELLSRTFQKIFKFDDILNMKNPYKMFMGIPGSGKSTAIAKVATKAKIAGIKSCIISADTVRAGANIQLQNFSEILGIEFYLAKTDRDVYDLSKTLGVSNKLVLIDTPGINPFMIDEIDNLSALVDVIKSDLIIVLEAGRNAVEAVEIADIFKRIGASYMLPTGLDLTKRMGTILSVADECDLSFCAASVGSSIAKGLMDFDAKSLARLI